MENINPNSKRKRTVNIQISTKKKKITSNTLAWQDHLDNILSANHEFHEEKQSLQDENIKQKLEILIQKLHA